MLFTGYQGKMIIMEMLRAVFCFDENLVAQVQVAAASLLDACASEEVHCEIHCVCTEAAGIVAEPLGHVISSRDQDSTLVMHCVEIPMRKLIRCGISLPELICGWRCPDFCLRWIGSFIWMRMCWCGRAFCPYGRRR